MVDPNYQPMDLDVLSDWLIHNSNSQYLPNEADADPALSLSALNPEITYHLDPTYTADEVALIEQAISVWEQYTGISFIPKTGREGTNSHIYFSNDGGDKAAEYYDPTTGLLNGKTIYINPSDFFASTFTTEIHYFSASALHEIGHALGLFNGGPYNADWGNRVFPEDSVQATIMSYYAPDGSSLPFWYRDNPEIDGDYYDPITPMLADLQAIDKMYGSLKFANLGETTYSLPQVAIGRSWGMTIVDLEVGKTDTIDLSLTSGNNDLKLTPGQASSLDGIKNNFYIYWGSEIENVIGSNQNDFIEGNDLSNEVSGENGHDNLFGGDGDDALTGGKGWNILDGGADFDTAFYDAEPMMLAISRGRMDEPFDPQAPLYVESFMSTGMPWVGYGTYKGEYFDELSNIEIISTGDADDKVYILGVGAVSGDSQETAILAEIHTKGGSDRVEGSEGQDIIFGGDENDFLFGYQDYGVNFTGTPQNGEYDGDTIHGDAGNDLIIGYNGNDSLFGGDNDDIMRGNWGSDSIDGGSGSDAIEGGYHEDTIDGESGNDFLWGFEASESLVDIHATTIEAQFRKIGAFQYDGEWNNNEIDGGIGDDYLIGSGGDDTLLGGDDNDILYGEYGSDMLTGGDGSDVFVFHGSWANGGTGDDDYILDFVSADDQILLSKPQIPDDNSYYDNFGWEFEADRIFFAYQEASWDQNGEKIWVDREGASLHVNATYDPNADIQYVDDFAFV